MQNCLVKEDCGYGLNEKNDTFERTFNFFNIRHVQLIIVLDLTLVDSFENGDQLNIYLDDQLFRSIKYNESILHHVQYCGDPEYRERMQREILDLAHFSSSLKLGIILVKGRLNIF